MKLFTIREMDEMRRVAYLNKHTYPGVAESSAFLELYTKILKGTMEGVVDGQVRVDFSTQEEGQQVCEYFNIVIAAGGGGVWLSTDEQGNVFAEYNFINVGY